MEKIPREYVQTITDLFDKLEKINGEKYQICVFTSGKDREIVIKSFEQRTNYLVEMTDIIFSGLNGSYPTFDDLKRKLILLDYPGSKLAEKVEETLWKCSFCEKDDGNKIGDLDTCRSCQKVHSSKWSHLRISLEEGKIFYVEEGKVENVGTIKILE